MHFFFKTMLRINISCSIFGFLMVKKKVYYLMVVVVVVVVVLIGCLPGVDRAVSVADSVFGGILNSGHNVDVFVREGDDLHQFVDFVPHFGGGQVVGGGFGVFASGSLDAR